MNGLMVIFLMDLRAMMEFQGGDDWVAGRLIMGSPLFGIAVCGSWVATPVDQKRR